MWKVMKVWRNYYTVDEFLIWVKDKDEMIVLMELLETDACVLEDME